MRQRDVAVSVVQQDRWSEDWGADVTAASRRILAAEVGAVAASRRILGSKTPAPTAAPYVPVVAVTENPTDAPTTSGPTRAGETIAPSGAPTTFAPSGAPTTAGPSSAPTGAPTIPNLRMLRLDHNQLHGDLEFMYEYPNLELRMVSSNQISGTISPQIMNLRYLSHFMAKSNQLSGTGLSHLQQLPKLQNVNLERNQIGGNWVTHWPSGMLHLSVCDNKIEGEVDLFSNSLITLDITRNRFKGKLNVHAWLC